MEEKPMPQTILDDGYGPVSEVQGMVANHLNHMEWYMIYIYVYIGYIGLINQEGDGVWPTETGV